MMGTVGSHTPTSTMLIVSASQCLRDLLAHMGEGEISPLSGSLPDIPGGLGSMCLGQFILSVSWGLFTALQIITFAAIVNENQPQPWIVLLCSLYFLLNIQWIPAQVKRHIILIQYYITLILFKCARGMACTVLYFSLLFMLPLLEWNLSYFCQECYISTQ